MTASVINTLMSSSWLMRRLLQALRKMKTPPATMPAASSALDTAGGSPVRLAAAASAINRPQSAVKASRGRLLARARSRFSGLAGSAAGWAGRATP